MKGDKKIYLPVHYKKAKFILKQLDQTLTTNAHKYIIAVAGESGTGKTEIASILQEYLYRHYNRTVKVIHVDDYYKTNWHVRTETRLRKGINYVGHNEVSWAKLNRILNQFKSGVKKINVQQIHMYTDSIEKQIVDARKLDIIIVEGLYALYTKEIDYGIYLEGSAKDTYAFRKKRAKENPDDTFRKHVLAKEAKEVQKSKDKANLIVEF